MYFYLNGLRKEDNLVMYGKYHEVDRSYCKGGDIDDLSKLKYKTSNFTLYKSNQREEGGSSSL